MKYLYIYTILFIASNSILSAQVPTAFSMSNDMTEAPAFDVSISFDADATGVDLFGTSFGFFIPAGYSFGSATNGYTAQNELSNAQLSGFCGAADADELSFVAIVGPSNAVNVDITTGVPVVLTTVTLVNDGTGVSNPEIIPLGSGSSIADCIAGAGIENAIEVDNGSGGISYGPLPGGANSILPIELTRFSATKGESSVNLDWSTSSEINGSHFDVQRSQNLADWATIGTVQAVGESSTEQNYNLVDRDLPLSTRSSKNFYYRLIMVDNDGTYEMSEIRTVRFDQDGAEFIVYPNPSVNEVFVNLSTITDETGPATMHMINMKGEKVKEVTLPTNDDISVDVSNITAGVYYFVVRQGTETFTQKVVKID